MTGAEAMKVVNDLTAVVQKMRSVSRETLGDDEVTATVMEQIEKWVFGPQSILPALAKIQDRGSVTGPQLYNLMFVAHTLAPYIGASALIMGTPLPQPDLAWHRGWE